MTLTTSGRQPGRSGPKPGSRKPPNKNGSDTGFRCPACDGKTMVCESRQDIDGGMMRRRSCRDCGHRFTTQEIIPGKVKGSDKEQLRLFRRLAPKLIALADEIDLLSAEHE